MDASILSSTKKILGVGETYTAFDLDILTHINSAFSSLDQLGIGPIGGFAVEDSTQEWDELGIPRNQLQMVKTYIFLKVRMMFDPPGTGFLIDAMQKQIQEHEWRLTAFHDGSFDSDVVEEEVT